MRTVLLKLKENWHIIIGIITITCSFVTVQVNQKILMEDVSVMKPELKSLSINMAEVKTMLEMMRNKQLSSAEGSLHVSN